MRFNELRKLAAFVFALVFCAGPAMADSAGTTAANFLKIPIAPIPAALGSAYTAMSGVDSIMYNPAGLGLLSFASFSGAHNQYLEGITQEYGALAVPFSWGRVGAAFTTLSSGDFDAYDENGSHIGQTNSSHMMFALSYANSFPYVAEDRGLHDRMLMMPDWSKIDDVERYRSQTFRFSFGGTVKYIRERLDDTSSSAMAFDGGVILVPYKYVQLGASVQNLGQQQKFSEEGFDLPLTYRAGIATNIVAPKRLVVVKFLADAVKEKDRDLAFNFGSEIGVNQMVQGRIGYRTNQNLGNGFTFGAGLCLDRFSEDSYFVSGVRFDYAYIFQGAFGASHRIGLQILFP
ncbi:MAG: hypothetical protein WCS77_05005 [Elusimicrobiaceae bacterium]